MQFHPATANDATENRTFSNTQVYQYMMTFTKLNKGLPQQSLDN